MLLAVVPAVFLPKKRRSTRRPTRPIAGLQRWGSFHAIGWSTRNVGLFSYAFGVDTGKTSSTDRKSRSPGPPSGPRDGVPRSSDNQRHHAAPRGRRRRCAQPHRACPEARRRGTWPCGRRCRAAGRSPCLTPPRPAAPERGLSRTNQPQTRHACEQGGEPVGQCRVLDDEGQSDWTRFSVLAQAAGLSAMVSETCLVSPARRSPIVTVWPMLSGPRACKTDCTCRIGSPFQSMTMSPCRRPPRLLVLEGRRSSPWRPICRPQVPRAGGRGRDSRAGCARGSQASSRHAQWSPTG